MATPLAACVWRHITSFSLSSSVHWRKLWPIVGRTVVVLVRVNGVGALSNALRLALTGERKLEVLHHVFKDVALFWGNSNCTLEISTLLTFLRPTKTHKQKPTYISTVSGLPDKLKDGHQKGERQAAEEDDEDAADVVNAQIVHRGGLLRLFGALTAALLLLPPALLQREEDAVLVQLQNGVGERISKRRVCE